MKSQQFNEPPLEQQVADQFERAGNWLTHTLPELLPIVASVIAVLWLASGVYSVHPGHVGVERTFGTLSILWGVLGARGVRWSLLAAIVTTGLLTLVFVWRASVGWLTVLDGQAGKLFAASLITLMLAASVTLLPVLFRASKPQPSAIPQSGA